MSESQGALHAVSRQHVWGAPGHDDTRFEGEELFEAAAQDQVHRYVHTGTGSVPGQAGNQCDEPGFGAVSKSRAAAICREQGDQMPDTRRRSGEVGAELRPGPGFQYSDAKKGRAKPGSAGIREEKDDTQVGTLGGSGAARIDGQIHAKDTYADAGNGRTHSSTYARAIVAAKFAGTHRDSHHHTGAGSHFIGVTLAMICSHTAEISGRLHRQSAKSASQPVKKQVQRDSV